MKLNNFHFLLLNSRWQSDALCDGSPFPKVFSQCKKTLGNLRTLKYGPSPKNGAEVREKFSRIEIMEALGHSLHYDHGRFFNDVIVTDKFDSCIFSSHKSISLIKQYTLEEKRFFILDGTFRITPKGVWQQTLILQISFGLKVKQI